MTLKEESVIENDFTKDQEDFGCDFPWFRFLTPENELSHCIYTKRCYWREKSEKKEQLIRELTQKNKT
jgi:hypothetical protein